MALPEGVRQEDFVWRGRVEARLFRGGPDSLTARGRGDLREQPPGPT